MPRAQWCRSSLVLCLLAAGCQGEELGQGSHWQGARSDGGSSDGWEELDESTGAPVELIALDGARPAVDEEPVVEEPVVEEPVDPTRELDASVPDSVVAHDAQVPEPLADAAAEIDAGPLQLACAPEESCDQLACAEGSCAVTCDGANKCKVDCAEDTRCAVSCVRANNCEPRCRGGSSCEIDCRDANNCDHVECEGDAQCVVHCGADTNCKIDKCHEPVRCSGNILVCNRACPPGSVPLAAQ